MGIASFVPKFMIKYDFSSYALYLLMFFVGIGIGADKSALSVIKQAKIKILLISGCVIVGSLIGAALFSFFIPAINFKEAMAIGAGFGYYSLSSILISKISGETLGVVALLANICREITTLLLAPLLVKYFYNLAPIASGGATSMDTTLPVIVKYEIQVDTICSFSR